MDYSDMAIQRAALRFVLQGYAPDDGSDPVAWRRDVADRMIRLATEAANRSPVWTPVAAVRWARNQLKRGESLSEVLLDLEYDQRRIMRWGV
jgi:hypothetical protein